MKYRVLMIGVFSLLLAGVIARADIQVTVDHNPSPAEPGFKFAHVPPPLKNDAAASPAQQGRGRQQNKFTIIDGQNDTNGSNLNRINDGLLPEEEDDPGSNFFFIAGGTGGRLKLDLGSVINVKQVNSYSWHDGTRAPQVYKLYAADGTATGFVDAPKRPVDPTTCGWKLLASVNTVPTTGRPGGQYGVSIADTAGSLGKYRYFLFDVSPTGSNQYDQTFYSEIDVRAMQPAEPEVLSGVDAKARVKNFDYTVDVSASPQLKEWVDTQLKPAIDKWYPIWVDCLASDGFTAPRKFTITIKPMDGVAATGGTHVDVSTSWIEGQLRNPQWNEAVGSVIHELVHIVQQYGNNNKVPGWVTEGIADYLRWFRFEPEARRPGPPSATAKYSDAYRTTARFFNWVAKTYDPEIVVKLNAAARQNRYSYDFWKENTGLTVQELWNEYVKANPPPARGTRGARGARATTGPGGAGGD